MVIIDFFEKYYYHKYILNQSIYLFELRNLLEKDIARYQKLNEKYENSHHGNFRLIYPTKETNIYDQFINPKASFYHETISYKIRTECAKSVS